MIDQNPPVTEEELHAYVDGELAPDRRVAVEAWLASHTEDADRVAQWRAQADAIRARFGVLASEPVPARFDLDNLARGARSWRGSAAAAVVLAFLTGGVVGWMAHGASAADVGLHEKTRRRLGVCVSAATLNGPSMTTRSMAAWVSVL